MPNNTDDPTPADPYHLLDLYGDAAERPKVSTVVLDLIDGEEVAERLKVSPRLVRALTQRGELPCVWVGRKLRRYRVSDVEAFIAANTRPART